MLNQVAFLAVMALAVFIIIKRIRFISGNIQLGRKTEDQGNRAARFRNMILVAFGQKKMFKRPFPALLHLAVYIGFLVINLEVLEFVLDGLLGTHRLFAPFLGAAYTVALNVFEVLALGVLVACVVFLLRRNVARLPRFWSAEMTAWPRKDANLILVTEIVLMIAILTMNAADQLLQGIDGSHYPQTGNLVLSSTVTPLLDGLSAESLVLVERTAWWFHIVGIFGFAIYVTYSKHLHIALAFPNTYFAATSPLGKVENMPTITKEVRIMLGMETASETPEGTPARFGAKDVVGLSRTTLLSAYSCTECGRCTSECPANITGKKLSPRKIMMDVRDRMEDLGRKKAKEIDISTDTNTLLDHYITREEINACTSCNACAEACPVLINPLGVILELKRYVVMEESAAPASWNAMFQNIETSFAPWKFAPSDRFKWSEKA